MSTLERTTFGGRSLHDRCITRDIHWGVKVPKSGYENKVFYVWFDAPNAYISMTQDWAAAHHQDWKRWWVHQLEDVQYVQFMAKDNVPFHAIFWPAVLLGTGQAWKFVDTIKGFSWLTYDGGKFSTSQHRGIFTDLALELYPADYWRYYLLSIAPEASDADFKFVDFARTINKDLADVLGNFVNRFDNLLQRHWKGCVPELVPDDSLAIHDQCVEIITAFKFNLEALSFRKTLHELRRLWSLGNEYFTATEPWKLIKIDFERSGSILVTAYYLLSLIAVASCS